MGRLFVKINFGMIWLLLKYCTFIVYHVFKNINPDFILLLFLFPLSHTESQSIS